MSDSPQPSPSSEAECARAAYDELMRRIVKFQKLRKPEETVVLKANDVAVDAVGVRGSKIWFQGKNAQGFEVWIVQHYSQMDARLTAAKLVEGEKPKSIGFLTE